MIKLIAVSIALTACSGASRPEPINSWLVQCKDHGGLRVVLRDVAYCKNSQLFEFR
jgi:hypothetical protein